MISPAVELAIVAKLDDPTTCPHGNPIPGSGYVERELVALSSLEPGATAVITRIPEELEFTPGLLEFLEANSIIPGAEATIITMSPDGTTTIEVEGSIVGVSSFTAERMLVAVLDAARV